MKLTVSGGTTLQRLAQLKTNLLSIDEQKQTDTLEIDAGFVTPLSIVPLAAKINERSMRCKTVGTASSYLSTICFPEGISDPRQDNCVRGTGTYFPLIHLSLSAVKAHERSGQLDALHSHFLDLVDRNVVADKKFMAQYGFRTAENRLPWQERGSCAEAFVSGCNQTCI